MNVRLIMRCLGSLVVISLLGFAPTARADGGDGLHQTVDGYTVTLAFPAAPPETGRNEALVTLYDPEGRLVEHAAVTAAVSAHTPPGGGHGDAHGESSASDTHSEGTTHADASTDAHSQITQDDSHGDDHAEDGHSHAALARPFSATADAGSYSGLLVFEEAGSWTLTVAFTVAGETRAVTFDVAVVQSRPRALVLGAFAAINALAIITAGVLRRRMPQKRSAKAASAGSSSSAPTASLPAQKDHTV